jgi:hypothetical protein
VLTAQREGLAQTPIVNPTTEGNDPIYAHWNYGLGKSIAFTSDLSGRWGGAWVTWSQFRGFWEQGFRWVMRQSSPRNLRLDTRIEGERAIVELESLDADAAFVNFMTINAVVLGPTGTREQLTMPQVGPGRYRGEFEIEDAGAYLVNVFYEGPSEGTVDQGNIQAAVNVPYPEEYRALQHNAVKLSSVSTITEGRELSMDTPAESLDLFARGLLPIPHSLREVWDLVVIIAASLFIFDVATRRLSIDRVWIRNLVRRALGRREDVGTDTVAAWKRTKSAVSHGSAQPEVVRDMKAQRDVKFEASDEDKALSIDVGAETPKDMRPGATQQPRTAPEKKTAADDDESHTSRLLAAKRRALKPGEEGLDESGDGASNDKGGAADG